MNNLTKSTQAILLLTSSFSKYASNEEQPLSASEWGLFASWLYEHNMKPEDLLVKEFEENLKEWSHEKITINRLTYLLQRGAALALAMEKWQRVGLWVITRSDKEYPKNIKKKLRHLSPPILYGIGNKSLLNTQTIAVVGSRDADQNNLTYAYDLGKKIANDGLALVSGGAKGIDEKVMQGALDNCGNGIVILAEDLLKNSLSSKYRNALLQNNLVLVSPYYPESPFSVANAMARNKYIYTISIASIVVHSKTSGGTWTGANEVLKKQWVPLWVQESIDSNSANQLLINSGANILTQDVLKNNLNELELSLTTTKTNPSLFDMNAEPAKQELLIQETESNASNSFSSDTNFDTGLSMYDFFIYKLKSTYNSESIFKPKDIELLLELKSTQINEWLLKAEADKILVRLDGRIKKYTFQSSDFKKVL